MRSMAAGLPRAARTSGCLCDLDRKDLNAVEVFYRFFLTRPRAWERLGAFAPTTRGGMATEPDQTVWEVRRDHPTGRCSGSRVIQHL